MPLTLDVNDLPPLLRVSDIVRDVKSGRPGILPLSRAAFLAAVADGYVPPPVRLGAKAVAWRREDILDIVKNGVQGRRPRGRKALAREALRQTEAGR
jgi:prophage regulatory protein